jgi:ankyrin repeat protein
MFIIRIKKYDEYLPSLKHKITWPGLDKLHAISSVTAYLKMYLKKTFKIRIFNDEIAFYLSQFLLLINNFGSHKMDTSKSNSTPNAKDKNPAAKDGWTPLHAAAQDGHLETVKLILQQAMDKNPADKDGWTPLYSAADNGHLDIVRLILQHAKVKNPADKDGWTPLHLAAQGGHLETV